MTLDRREFLKWVAACGGTAVAGCAGMDAAPGAAKVVVIGGGFGGATAARHVKLWAPDIDVTVVERNAEFVSCPISNLVLAATPSSPISPWATTRCASGRAHGARRGRLGRSPARQVRLAGGSTLSYDRLIVSPGIDFIYDQLPGLQSAEAQSRVLHAWKAGPQTAALRKQLEGMRDGGVFVFHIPMAPYRCPPGPYERVCQVADYFKRAKPKSKIIVLDSNPDIASKPGLFRAAWKGMYEGLIDYRPNSELADVDAKGMTVRLTFDR